MKRFYCWLL